MKIKLLTLLIIALSLISCKSRRSFEGGSMDKSEEPRGLMNEMEVSSQIASPDYAQKIDVASAEKKLIKTAYMSMEVANYESARKKLGFTLTNHKAYIISENLQNTPEMLSNTINIRVPAELFERLIADITKIAKRVDYQNIDSQDITEEYMDLETRLRNKKKIEQSFLKLLRKANSVDDILKIENKLGEIRSEIEAAEGRLKYLKHQTELSTISLTLYQKLEYTYQPEETPKFFQRLKKALDSGWKATISFLLFILKIWPFWIFLAICYIVYKYITNLRKQKRKERKRKRKELKIASKTSDIGNSNT